MGGQLERTPDLVIDTATELWEGIRDMATWEREREQARARTQVREPGYYWVRWLPDSPWRVSVWGGAAKWAWVLISDQGNVTLVAEMHEVGPRILPPDHTPTRLAETATPNLLDRISQHAMLILELSALAADGGGKRRQGVGGGEAAESDIDQATRRAPITTGPGPEGQGEEANR